MCAAMYCNVPPPVSRQVGAALEVLTGGAAMCCSVPPPVLPHVPPPVPPPLSRQVGAALEVLTGGAASIKGVATKALEAARVGGARLVMRAIMERINRCVWGGACY